VSVTKAPYSARCMASPSTDDESLCPGGQRPGMPKSPCPRTEPRHRLLLLPSIESSILPVSMTRRFYNRWWRKSVTFFTGEVLDKHWRIWYARPFRRQGAGRPLAAGCTAGSPSPAQRRQAYLLGGCRLSPSGWGLYATAMRLRPKEGRDGPRATSHCASRTV
jgi:hypothetical protein